MTQAVRPSKRASGTPWLEQLPGGVKGADGRYRSPIRRTKSLRIIYGAVGAILLASAFSQPGHAQAQIQIPGVGQLTVPGYGQAPPPSYHSPPGYGQAPPPGYGQGERYDHQHWEHCQHLEHREHEIRRRLENTAYGEDRERMEYYLHQIHEEREHECWHH